MRKRGKQAPGLYLFTPVFLGKNTLHSTPDIIQTQIQFVNVSHALFYPRAYNAKSEGNFYATAEGEIKFCLTRDSGTIVAAQAILVPQIYATLFHLWNFFGTLIAFGGKSRARAKIADFPKTEEFNNL